MDDRQPTTQGVSDLIYQCSLVIGRGSLVLLALLALNIFSIELAKAQQPAPSGAAQLAHKDTHLGRSSVDRGAVEQATEEPSATPSPTATATPSATHARDTIFIPAIEGQPATATLSPSTTPTITASQTASPAQTAAVAATNRPAAPPTSVPSSTLPLASTTLPATATIPAPSATTESTATATIPASSATTELAATATSAPLEPSTPPESATAEPQPPALAAEPSPLSSPTTIPSATPRPTSFHTLVPTSPVVATALVRQSAVPQPIRSDGAGPLQQEAEDTSFSPGSAIAGILAVLMLTTLLALKLSWSLRRKQNISEE